MDVPRDAPLSETCVEPTTDFQEIVQHSPAESDTLFGNRELSFLSFNERVLELASDESMPLLERLRYLCISSSNLDEFFEVRVAGVKQALAGNVTSLAPDGISPQQQLKQIDERSHRLVERQYTLFNDYLIPLLAEQGVRFLRRGEWEESLRDWVEEFFDAEILPVLSPLALDPAHPFPNLTNKSLNFIITLEGADAFGRNINYALLRAPRSLPRVIPVPEAVCGYPHGFVFLSSIVHAQMASLFPGMEPTGVYQFRVTRNSDLYVSDEEAANLRGALEEELLYRNYGQAVRLEVADNCPGKTLRYLLSQFDLQDQDVFKVNGPVNLNRLFSIPDLIDRPDLKFPNFTPYVSSFYERGANIFERIHRRGSMAFHHPYDGYLPVVEFVRQAARDPDVLAIKQTLYRTGTESVFVKYLMEAARAGKDVTVIIELRARFDEEANIELAQRLEEAGIQVVYGVVGFKTHAKMILVVRREKKKLVRYAHIGTGNYHTSTARLYTDISVLTTDKQTTKDVQKVFMQLSGLGKAVNQKKLLQAPFTLHSGLIKRVEREIVHAREGRPAHIMARMNSLVEPKIVSALYEASAAGVKVDLLVRGICVLKPGVPGLSENIRVVSVLGRFLEHSRVFYFLNDGDSDIFISSADWMPRNFFARVEVAAPLDGEIADRVREECLEAFMRDNTYSWTLQSDGEYVRNTPGDASAFSVQQWLRDSSGKSS
ncbi:MAG TPA: polyphosphate kinase 1 [Gammaproteobacteria bacterium]|nr:polyphosphate kinase 1 [Gammaproteobacteria bacterium]